LLNRSTLLDAYVVHQVMKRRFDHVHLRQNAEVADLANVMARPTPYVILDMMELFVQALKSFLYRLAILLMLGSVDELRYFKNLVGLTIRLTKPGVVPVVVVQVETEIVAQRLKTRCEIVGVRKAAEIDGYWLVRSLLSSGLWNVVVAVVAVVVGAVMAIMRRMWHNVSGVRVNDIVVVAPDDMAV
jgi:hypothetical protein